jgi:hypothetical protein
LSREFVRACDGGTRWLVRLISGSDDAKEGREYERKGSYMKSALDRRHDETLDVKARDA